MELILYVYICNDYARSRTPKCWLLGFFFHLEGWLNISWKVNVGHKIYTYPKFENIWGICKNWRFALLPLPKPHW